MMRTKNRLIGESVHRYRWLSGLMLTAAVALVLPGRGDAAGIPAPIITGSSTPPITTGCLNSGGNSIPCPPVSAVLTSGHGYFTAMCYSNYTAARAVTPALVGLTDLPGACDGLSTDQYGVSDLMKNTPNGSFTGFDFGNVYTGDTGTHQLAHDQSNWWGATTHYDEQYYGNADDTYWLDTEKSSYGQDTNYIDRPGGYSNSGGDQVYTCCSWWGAPQYAYSTQRQLYSDSHVSYFSGHGSLDNGSPNADGVSETPCNKDSECTASIPAGFYAPALCRSFPGSLPAGDAHKGVCRYNNYRYLLTSTYGDNPGPTGPLYGKAKFDNQTNISGGQVRLGESPFSGDWAGVGTNGGVNWVIFQAENVIEPALFASEWGRMFSGVHAISATMNVTAANPNAAVPITSGVYYDTKRVIAAMFQFNANADASISLAWNVATVGLPAVDGTACGKADFSQGGRQGYNGCGCQVTMVVDSTQALALNRITNETFNQVIQDDSKDIKAANYYNYRFVCNYSGGPAGGPATYFWNNP